MPGDERRRGERAPYVAFAWYRLINDEGEPVQEGIARSIDLSAEGMGIVAPRPLELGRRFFVNIRAPRGTISAVAVVVNVTEREGGTYRVGFRFEILPPSDIPVLRKMVAS